MGALERALRGARDRGEKAFVPYVTGGYPGVDAGLLRGLASAGADAVEVGIPHSDPIMDGGVIQEASRVALQRGTHPTDVLALVKEAGLGIPVAVMTYTNPVYRRGYAAFCDDLVDAGVAGAIVPDLPVDEAGEFDGLAAARDIDAVLLAAPGTTEARYAAIGAASHGFVYCVATYGVTGARDELGSSAEEVVAALRAVTDLPLLVGVGIGTPAQAVAACGFADGVIVGSALMAAFMEGGRERLEELASGFHTAIAAG
jgi:tryptophan synthase alpha chain